MSSVGTFAAPKAKTNNQTTAIDINNNNENIIKRLTYYQKPIIGNDSGERLITPLHLKFPSGGFGLGISSRDPNIVHINRERDASFAVMASSPEYNSPDEFNFRGLQVTFFILAFMNILITSILYFQADVVDLSKVENQTRSIPSVFEIVSDERRNVEQVNYSFTIILIVLACISVIARNCLGLSIYCLSMLLNFILGTSSLPYFVYSFRYIFDISMFYIALVIRSRLMFTFLPLQQHRNV